MYKIQYLKLIFLNGNVFRSLSPYLHIFQIGRLGTQSKIIILICLCHVIWFKWKRKMLPKCKGIKYERIVSILANIKEIQTFIELSMPWNIFNLTVYGFCSYHWKLNFYFTYNFTEGYEPSSLHGHNLTKFTSFHIQLSPIIHIPPQKLVHCLHLDIFFIFK